MARRFYKIKDDIEIDKQLKSLVFKCKEGYFVDLDEEIYLENNTETNILFQETPYNTKNDEDY